MVENVCTMAELKLIGTCLRGSRPLLSFDPVFKEKPHYILLKELFTQIFGVPNHHPKSNHSLTTSTLHIYENRTYICVKSCEDIFWKP